MNDAGGLRITVVRDTQLSSCFAVFSVESPVPPPVAEVIVPPSPGELARQEAILRMGEAAVRRNQQLADLNAEFERRTGRPYSSLTSNSTYAVDPVLLGNYQQDLQKINQEYQNVMLSIVPGTFPYAAACSRHENRRIGRRGQRDEAGAARSKSDRDDENDHESIRENRRHAEAADRRAAARGFRAVPVQQYRHPEAPVRRSRRAYHF